MQTGGRCGTRSQPASFAPEIHDQGCGPDAGTGVPQAAMREHFCYLFLQTDGADVKI